MYDKIKKQYADFASRELLKNFKYMYFQIDQYFWEIIFKKHVLKVNSCYKKKCNVQSTLGYFVLKIFNLKVMSPYIKVFLF